MCLLFIYQIFFIHVSTTYEINNNCIKKGYFCIQREEPDVMFADNRTCGGANSAQILYKNDKKVYRCEKYYYYCLKILGKLKLYEYETNKDIDFTSFI